MPRHAACLRSNTLRLSSPGRRHQRVHARLNALWQWPGDPAFCEENGSPGQARRWRRWLSHARA